MYKPVLHEQTRGVKRTYSASELLDECLVHCPFDVAKLKPVFVRNGLRKRDPSGERVHSLDLPRFHGRFKGS